jgi:hypothetical protein
LLAELLPITILLDEAQDLGGRWVRIHPVQHLEISVAEGVRLITSGQLRWTVGFLPVTITVERLVVMLRPIVVGTGAASRLLFRPVLEEADLRNVPAMLDRGVVGLVNGALERRSERLAWDFGRTLALRFLLPDALDPLEAAAVDVEAARLRVRDDVLELTVTLTMHISRLAADRATTSPAA